MKSTCDLLGLYDCSRIVPSHSTAKGCSYALRDLESTERLTHVDLHECWLVTWGCSDLHAPVMWSKGVSSDISDSSSASGKVLLLHMLIDWVFLWEIYQLSGILWRTIQLKSSIYCHAFSSHWICGDCRVWRGWKKSDWYMFIFQVCIRINITKQKCILCTYIHGCFRK